MAMRRALRRWRRRRRARGGRTGRGRAGRGRRGRPFRRALVISLLNPKAILFFISFFIQFVDPAYAYPALSFLLLGDDRAGLQRALPDRADLRRDATWPRSSAAGGGWPPALTAGVGALFVGFGIKLATAPSGRAVAPTGRRPWQLEDGRRRPRSARPRHRYEARSTARSVAFGQFRA